MIVESLITKNSELLKLNIGCGSGKLAGFINIDVDKSLEPDQVFDIRGALPLEDNSVDEITCYHTIEHIDKAFWQGIFLDFSRVLIPDGKLVLTFPNYLKVFKYWETNHKGLRHFWENVIFGGGTSVWDRHVSVTTEREVSHVLISSGFEVVESKVEPVEDHNWYIRAINRKPLMYKDVLKEAVWPTKLNFEKGLGET
jgi:predicted SAM-dependent methyltransferase